MNSIQALLISAIGVFFYILEILIFVRILFSWLPFGVGYNSSHWAFAVSADRADSGACEKYGR